MRINLAFEKTQFNKVFTEIVVNLRYYLYNREQYTQEIYEDSNLICTEVKFATELITFCVASNV